MGEIRKFEEAHIPEVATLELKVFHRRSGMAGVALEQYFEEIFFRNPWASFSLPSFVYLDRGKVVGFLGVMPRPMEFNGRKILAGVTSQLMVDTDAYRGFAGLALMKHFLDGPQDLSFTDGGTEAAFAIWTAWGAKVARLYALDWHRTLRPTRYFQGMVSQHRKASLRAIARLIYPACWLADTALSNLPFDQISAPVAELPCESVGAEELFQCVKEIGWRDALRPAYDPVAFYWLLDQAATATRRGTLRMIVVRNPDGAPVGWCVYYSKSSGVSVVLQVGAAGGCMDKVLSTLWHDARVHGAVALRGQVMPRNLLDFHLQHCSFNYPSNGVLVHSRDPQLMACVLQGEAALTRLDGEWWTRFGASNW
jgi:hypothetical protein